MINVKRASESIGRLAILKFFPADNVARTEILKLICEMVTTNEQIDWLVNRARSLWNEWEGPRELRAIVCSKYRPADGIEAYSQLPQFADGIPAEKQTAPQLEGAALKQLEAGPIADREMQALVVSMAPTKNLNAVRGPAVKPVVILPGETEYGALQRSVEQSRKDLAQAKQPYAASDEMIAHVKRQQLEAATSDETKAILTQEARAAKRRALDDAAKAELVEAIAEAK